MKRGRQIVDETKGAVALEEATTMACERDPALYARYERERQGGSEHDDD